MDINECYEILELPPGSDLDAIKSSYRDLIQVWHPDRFGHSRRLQKRANDKLKDINEAYYILCNHYESIQKAPLDKSHSLVYQKNIHELGTKLIEIAKDPDNYKEYESKELYFHIMDYAAFIASSFSEQPGYGKSRILDGRDMSIWISILLENTQKNQQNGDRLRLLGWRGFPIDPVMEGSSHFACEKTWKFASSAINVTKISEEIIDTFITVFGVSPDEQANISISTNYFDFDGWY